MKKLFVAEKKKPVKKLIIHDCSTCKFNNRKKYEGEGKFKKKILVLSTTFSYSILSTLEAHGLNDIDCFFYKIVACANTNFIDNESIKNCSKNLLDKVNELKPAKIIVIGTTTLKALLGDRISSRISFNSNIWNGWQIPDQELKSWIFPIQDIFSLDDYQLQRDRSLEFFASHIKAALEHNKEIPIFNIKKDCEAITSIDRALEVISLLMKKECIAFDYETTGIKPHRKPHRIICLSISDNEKSYSFPCFDDKVFKNRLRDLFENKDIKKIGHNIKFEETWTRVCLGYSIVNWYFDTQLGQHLLDNREGVTGLKFQSYVNFGVLGYDDAIDSYLVVKKGEDTKSANAFNRVDECPLEDLLLYCAMDSRLTYMLYEKQIVFFNHNTELEKAYQLFHEGTLAFSDIENNGMRIDIEQLSKNENEIAEKMTYIIEEILKSNEVKEWKQNHESEFNFKSTKQLGELLYDILDYSPQRLTATQKGSTDEKALEFINTEFTKNILKYRKLEKIKNTYLAGFKREAVDGIIHPSFNLNTVSTYRSSANNPNFQNIAKRNEEAKEYIKSTLIPKNDAIIELDYSSIEVSIGACYHQDPTMIKYILDTDSDMHRDTAADLFLKKANEITKQERQAAKNGFVFPQFYGDYWKQCAVNIWEQLDSSTKRHLRNKDICGLEEFSFHVKKIEENFWKERFFVYNEWRNRNWNKYLKRGVLEYKTGFYINSNMEKRVCNNAAIQGTAFHCLLRTLIYVNKLLKKGNYKTFIIGQIHDSLVLDVNLNEWENGLFKQIQKIMLKDLRDAWKWIIVPIRAEAEYYFKNWATSEKSEKFN
jgi:DNA polymerase I-like protein with 3'-5' exonuclease and polymerase domains